MKKKKITTRTITMTALLAAISFLLAFLEFPVPFSPSFARMDFSDFPALIGAFAFGPLVGVLIELVKNLLQLTSTATGGIGELANFVMGGSFVLTAGLIYKKMHTKKGAVIACIVSSIVMGVVAAFMNYYVLLPMFESFMPLDEVIAAFGEAIPWIDTKFKVIAFNCFPFNLIKGLLISVVTFVVYKRLSPFLKGSDFNQD